MATKRFATEVPEREATELELMRVELTLPQASAQVVRNGSLLSVMRLTTKKVMDDIRARRKSAGGPDALSTIVTWEDVADELGIPKEAMRELIERDPREQTAKATKADDSGQEVDHEADKGD